MTTPTIESVTAREILDCRLEPTLRVTVETTDGHTGEADVPTGRSTGRHEATQLRDGDDRYRGLGVKIAVENVTGEIAQCLDGRDVREQAAIDEAMTALDGTTDKAHLGGNAITGASLAVLKAGAAATDRPLYHHIATLVDRDGTTLPIPWLDMIEGGELAATGLDFQEHQLVPTGAESLGEAIRMGAEVYYELGDQLAERYDERSINVGVEGGYTPPIDDPRIAFDELLEAVEACGYDGAFTLAIDAAASHCYDPEEGTYTIMGEQRSPGELLDLYTELTDTYPVISIEDPFHEDAFERTAELTDRLDCQIVGDDLFVTQRNRLDRGIDIGAGTALLCKVNQVGTITETIETVTKAHEAGYAVQVSERSGQTPDTWLADLAVGLDAGQIKTGVTRGERTEQYNRLLGIDRELGAGGEYGPWPPT
ncbi:MAG: enolase C-terminal domain-like protein [Halobacteriales archaeon]|nr:enolase C-terminal domain-like protein [Halobacteriales archaeon]